MNVVPALNVDTKEVTVVHQHQGEEHNKYNVMKADSIVVETEDIEVAVIERPAVEDIEPVLMDRQEVRWPLLTRSVNDNQFLYHGFLFFLLIYFNFQLLLFF